MRRVFLASGLAAGLLAGGLAHGATSFEMEMLAERRGCTTCHAPKPSPAAKDSPIAPSWEEIAIRYRGVAGAEKKLSVTIVGGTDGRHWPDTAFKGMLPNEGAVRPDQARALARWILER